MRALAVVRSLPEHSLIDRLVRGRAWIPVLGVLLAGIIAMQVEVLKLGTSMGKLVQRSTMLQSQNESLQASVAALGDDQRIERLASGMGMVMPAPTTIAFLKAAPGGDARRALANLHAPDPTTFASELAAQVASAAASTGASAASSAATSVATTGTAAGGQGIPSAGSTTGTSAPSAATTTATATTVATTTATTVAAATPAQQSSSAGTTGAASAPQSPDTGAAAMAPTGSSQSGISAGG